MQHESYENSAIAGVNYKCIYAMKKMTSECLRAEVSSILQTYIDNEKERSELYSKHSGLQPVFEFFGTRLADDYRLLLDGLQDLGMNSELVVFTLFTTNDGTVVAGYPHHKLLFKRITNGNVMTCEDNRGKAVRVKSDNAVILVRPGAQLTRDIMEFILAME